MVVWTVFVVLGLRLARAAAAACCTSPTSRSTLLVILSTPLVQTEAMLDRHASTMPSFWVVAAGARLGRGRGTGPRRPGGRGARLGRRPVGRAPTSPAPPGATSSCSSWRRDGGLDGTGAAEAAELRAAARARGRGRRRSGPGSRGRSTTACSRCSALVQRRGAEAGGEPRRARPAGRRAGGRAARAGAVRRPRARPRRRDRRRATDLHGGARRRLGAGSRCRVPAAPVALAAPPGRASWRPSVGACLDNVARHVGDATPRPGCCSRTWATEVVVSVRDEGPGIPAAARRGAAREGRLGVATRSRAGCATSAARAVLTTGARGGHRVGAAPAATTGERRDRRRLRVMVVDDHPMWRDAVARDLAEAGHEVVATAADGGEAVRRAPAARAGGRRAGPPAAGAVRRRGHRGAGGRRPDGAGAGPVGVGRAARTCSRPSRPGRPATW